MNFAMAFLLGITIGALCDALIACFYHLLSHKSFVNHPRFGNANKLALISLPIWGVLGLVATQNFSYVWFFVIAALVGTLLEIIAGELFKRLFGVTIWSYRHAKITHYTSLYVIPYWGGAALVFLILAQLTKLQS